MAAPTPLVACPSASAFNPISAKSRPVRGGERRVMNYIVKISWYSGGCELLAVEFFPTTIEKTRKLFKLLVADPGWDDGKVRELLDYFKERKVREVKKAEEARSMAQGLMREAEVIKARCSRNSEEYQEYMRLRDKALDLGRSSTTHLNAARYCVKAYALLRDMWGGNVV